MGAADSFYIGPIDNFTEINETGESGDAKAYEKYMSIIRMAEQLKQRGLVEEAKQLINDMIDMFAAMDTLPPGKLSSFVSDITLGLYLPDENLGADIGEHYDDTRYSPPQLRRQEPGDLDSDISEI